MIFRKILDSKLFLNVFNSILYTLLKFWQTLCFSGNFLFLRFWLHDNQLVCILNINNYNHYITAELMYFIIYVFKHQNYLIYVDNTIILVKSKTLNHFIQHILDCKLNKMLE